MSLGGRPCERGQRRTLEPAKPMDPNRRIFSYLRDSGRADSPRQRRRRLHKLGRLAALERAGKSTALSTKHAPA